MERQIVEKFKSMCEKSINPDLFSTLVDEIIPALEVARGMLDENGLCATCGGYGYVQEKCLGGSKIDHPCSSCGKSPNKNITDTTSLLGACENLVRGQLQFPTFEGYVEHAVRVAEQAIAEYKKSKKEMSKTNIDTESSAFFCKICDKQVKCRIGEIGEKTYDLVCDTCDSIITTFSKIPERMR